MVATSAVLILPSFQARNFPFCNNLFHRKDVEGRKVCCCIRHHIAPGVTHCW